MIPITKLLGSVLAMSFLTIMLMLSIYAGQVQLAYASGESPFESGYNHGCDDARITNPSDRYINQPGKGPNYHTPEFMRGYNAGYYGCPGSGGGGGGNPGPVGGINWMEMCQRLDPIIIPSCSTLVYSNNVLTVEGERVKGCIQNGLGLAGGGTYLLNHPLPVTIGLLRVLSDPTGCGSIIEWNFIGSVGDLRGIIDLLS
jgi:hypothetical protein